MFGIKKLKEKVSNLESKIETTVLESDMKRIVGEKAVAIINWTQQNSAKYNVGDSVLYNEETCKVITVELAGHSPYVEQRLTSLSWLDFGLNNNNPVLHWAYLIDNKKGKTYTVKEKDLKPLTHEK